MMSIVEGIDVSIQITLWLISCKMVIECLTDFMFNVTVD